MSRNKYGKKSRNNFFNLLLLISIVGITASCSVPAMTNPDSYQRKHEVFAVDFNPSNLNNIEISKMDEGTWIEMGQVKNGQNSKYSISIEDDHLIVTANETPMDVPNYKTWLNYAMEELGYTTSSPYDVFDTVEEGWIYSIDLEEFPLVEAEEHRMIMYENK
ncbi:hypothetical protein RM549_12850 [Salegentibacter sp. F188]|uniref:Lipoprotein n=1 Tax=Autumnicola patrickiae TaxID=3075591 RepID=A0ABU3E3V4_9FLAO|nr:hypothetical protein [Salegentibacter sp. F188]MDT0690680.1 hypothetical protein [Salegentibacter sp. F188]